jgi:hypothetical protein
MSRVPARSLFWGGIEMAFLRVYCPVWLVLAVCLVPAVAQEQAPTPRALTPDLPPTASVASFPTAGGKPYPINLPTAMKLGNVRGLDIELASRRLQVAAAQLRGANVLWLPNLLFGADYSRHDGPIQTIEGPVIDTSRSSFIVGGAPYAVFALADAIFSPLAVRQTVRAR